MPKNKGKGGKNRRRGKKGSLDTEKRELAMADEEQAYAQVTKMLGNGRLMCLCFSKGARPVERMGTIRGTLRKKVWIGLHDIILVGIREYQEERVDVLHKYTSDEARELIRLGELPKEVRINDTFGAGGDDQDDQGFVIGGQEADAGAEDEAAEGGGELDIDDI